MRRKRNEKLAKEIGFRLFVLRMRKKLEIKAVAADLNLNPRTIGKFESGQLMPRIETLMELVNYYGTTMDSIVGLGGETI